MITETRTAQEYAAGRADGYAWADQDRAQYEPSSFWLETFRDEARVAPSRGVRAYYLGVLRAYREAVRTRTFVRDADGEAISERWGT